MRYRASSTPPKGRWARFLQAQRQKRGWSQTRAFEELRAGLNLGPKSRASYVNIDLGNREPTVDEAEYIVGFYGEEPEPEAIAPVADMAALVAALDRQTEAINQLVGRFDVLASSAIREGVEAALREAAEARGAGGSPLAPLREQLA